MCLTIFIKHHYSFIEDFLLLKFISLHEKKNSHSFKIDLMKILFKIIQIDYIERN